MKKAVTLAALFVAVTLTTSSAQPTNIVYTVDDFSTNGVGPENPTNDDYFATAESYAAGDIDNVWSLWFGAICGITFDPNVNVSGDTNSHGALAIQLCWHGSAVDGYQQWVLWHGDQGETFVPVPGGTDGIGYPQYTNLECDVMFAPGSCTNTNGVLGVIRLGVRIAGQFGQGWLSSSYTTITNAGVWYHLNGALNSSDTDLADSLIGEDVTADVGGGGLDGNQTLYVDNIRFTGPAVLPGPTLDIQQARPGLRIFAGTANAYYSETLSTVDQNQSWVGPGVVYPVSYTFSLQDYNPDIGQTMVELTGGFGSCVGCPQPLAVNADIVDPDVLWLVLTPGAVAGQVMASVQWKTNQYGVELFPNITAAQFTNSTAVGTWSLVLTGPTNGYVVAPGQVIAGSTNFTIADPTVTSDFTNPVVAAFGLRPATTAGEGQYIDWGMMSVSGVAGTNEFEDFTREGSDIVSNTTPSGEFNNIACALPASTIIQTTNDAWWMNWTQDAGNAAITNLVVSADLANSTWISPGYFSGYTDTTPPRVMALPQPFAGTYWVLVPFDDLPTADGQPNLFPPAYGPLAPQAFFMVASTNTVSPP